MERKKVQKKAKEKAFALNAPPSVEGNGREKGGEEGRQEKIQGSSRLSCTQFFRFKNFQKEPRPLLLLLSQPLFDFLFTARNKAKAATPVFC
mmetsp:Transcript_21593/g.42935  ORF Transcript_21593/g.42935 Transcript_21593/m.42935 type:complete len:92 (+) Transcript_21593:747-1022(+)